MSRETFLACFHNGYVFIKQACDFPIIRAKKKKKKAERIFKNLHFIRNHKSKQFSIDMYSSCRSHISFLLLSLLATFLATFLSLLSFSTATIVIIALLSFGAFLPQWGLLVPILQSTAFEVSVRNSCKWQSIISMIQTKGKNSQHRLRMRIVLQTFFTTFPVHYP